MDSGGVFNRRAPENVSLRILKIVKVKSNNLNIVGLRLKCLETSFVLKMAKKKNEST